MASSRWLRASGFRVAFGWSGQSVEQSGWTSDTWWVTPRLFVFPLRMKPKSASRAAIRPKSATLGVTRPMIWRMDHIHRRILEGGYPNCSVLAQEMEVTAKTVQRDITFMQTQRNMPIEYDPVKHGYYYAEPVSQFPQLKITRGELVALFVAKQALPLLRGGSLHKLVAESFAKIAEACPEEVTLDWEELSDAFSVSASGEVAADAVLFGHLVDAVLQRREITFDYRALNGRLSKDRRVRPYHVGRLNQGWYVVGLDAGSDELRTFALPRMSGLVLTSVKFKRPEDFNIHEQLAGGFGVWSYGRDAHVFDVKLRFAGWAARVVSERRWHHTQQIAANEDGSVTFSARLSGLEEITRWVLGFGSQAEVLAPAALKQRVHEEVLAICRRLNDSQGSTSGD